MTSLPEGPGPSSSQDLPPWLIRLARQVVRDCHRPGVYAIILTVPYHGRRKPTATIAKVETIRRLGPEEGKN